MWYGRYSQDKVGSPINTGEILRFLRQDMIFCVVKNPQRNCNVEYLGATI